MIRKWGTAEERKKEVCVGGQVMVRDTSGFVRR
jgi:hypothetical protein